MKTLNRLKTSLVCATLLAGSAFLAGCQTTTSATPASDFPAANVSSQTNVLLRREYTEAFRIGDLVTTEVFQVEALSGQFRVGSDGMVDFPIIGNVKVLGQTTEQLQRELKRLYGEDYLNNPTIVVTREAALRGRIVVDGLVAEPGIFDVYDDISLMVAIAQAGGLKELADPRRVFVMREVDGQRLTGLYNLRGIREEGLQDPIIVPGDVIYVDNNTRKEITTEILRVLPLAALLLTNTNNP